MIETNIPEIDPDDLLRRVRKEVASRKISGFRPTTRPQRMSTDDQTFRPVMQKTLMWRIIKKMQSILKKFFFYDFVYTIAKRFKGNIAVHRAQFTLHDFLPYHDEKFIKNAYRGILNREPDPHGLREYGSKLLNGQLSKIEVMGRLRYSEEGRQKRIQVKGLFIRYALNTAYHIPVIGYVLNLATDIISLPRTLRDIQKQAAATEALFAKSFKSIQNIEQTLMNKVDRSTVDVMQAQVNAVQANTREIQAQINFHKQEIADHQRRLSVLFEELRTIGGPVAATLFPRAVEEEAHLYDAMYVAFEDRFRGSRESIIQRQIVYLPYIEQVRTDIAEPLVLDIGCGRGEWLELLKKHRVAAKGIDTNRIMIQQCLGQGLDVKEADAMEYIKAQKTSSIGIITGFHIAEHLPYRNLITLFDESFRVLMPGGMLILETPNPENLIVGACNFYTDPTHKRPIPPDSLKFTAEHRGFANTTILRLHKIQETNQTGQDLIDDILKRMNMEQDYSIIARKAR